MNLGAINIPKVEATQWQESLKSRFFSPENVQDENGDKIHNDFLIIFHCEFSSKRGPDLRSWFRKNDRQSNVSPFYRPRIGGSTLDSKHSCGLVLNHISWY